MGRYVDFAQKLTLENQTFYTGLVHGDFQYVGPEILIQIDTSMAYRLDNISYRAYNTPVYWWVIALHNQIKDPLFDLAPGVVLKIPSDITQALDSVRRMK